MRDAKKRFVQKHPSLALLVFLLLLTALAFHYFWLVAAWFVPSRTASGAISISDEIAAASALFSALAFVAVIYTILLQRHDLVSQRADQDALQEQVTRQAFEGTFFQLLRLHNENVRSQSVELMYRGETFIGRRAFVAAAGELEEALAAYVRHQGPEPLDLSEINRINSKICETSFSDFGHYFRNLYHLIKFVDAARGIDTARYIAHTRAQLSQAEFVLLAANGLRKGGRSKFKPLIEKHSLLHDIRLNPTLEAVVTFYRKAALGVTEDLTVVDRQRDVIRLESGPWI